MFAAALLVFLVSPVRLETDSHWLLFTARSIVAEGNADLDEYRAIIGDSEFQIERLSGHTYYEVPLGASLAAVPFVAIVSTIDASGLDSRLDHNQTQPFDGWIAAILAAIAVAMVYVMARRLTTVNGIAVATALLFAFGTQVWSTASRTMWMHGPSIICLIAALLLAQRVDRSGSKCTLLGATLALAYFVRPTNVVPAVVLAIWIMTLGKAPFLRLIRGAAVVALSFGVLNLILYGRLLQPYFRASRVAVSDTTIEALLGNLVSPSRGLLVFVPIVALSIYGFVLKRGAGALTRLDIAVAASAVGYWLLVSAFPHWYGGYSYGPRLTADLAPLVVWFLPPLLERTLKRESHVLAVIVVAVVIASVTIQARGAWAESTTAWNHTPTDIDADPSRIWDWSDPQFLR